MNLAILIAKDLIAYGIESMYGVQGGACARIIDSFVAEGGSFKPVLNEQSAGYMAQGYFAATGKPAIVVATTGPGVTNLVSGVASCYFDRIPLLCLVGQVKVTSQLSRATKTRMVGFQEVRHLDVLEPVSDVVLSVRSIEDYIAIRGIVIESLCRQHKTVVIEIPDDIQRLGLSSNSIIEPISLDFQRKECGIEVTSVFAEVPDLVILGSGCRDISNECIDSLVAFNCPILLSWGAQCLAPKLRNKAQVHLFGTHTPGLGNKLIRQAKCPLVVGCSLLQHQIGKIPSRFLPLSEKINYVNSDLNELGRFDAQFGGRANAILSTAESFLARRHGFTKGAAEIVLQNSGDSQTEAELSNASVNVLVVVLKAFSFKGRFVFTDAGATLSWTFQALQTFGLRSNLQIYSSFNLHPMGFSNCAAVGCCVGLKAREPVLAIIGDGSVPMNCQELAWIQSSRVKVVVVDNSGYGIIRMTQDDFYGGRHLGSEFGTSNRLPSFSAASIARGFRLSAEEVSANDISEQVLEDFFESGVHVLVIKTPESDRVKVDFYE